MRLTYSVTTGSRMSLEVASTSWAYCLPMRISPSSEYQSPSPRPPTLRFPIAFTSFLLPSCLTLLSSGCSTTGGGVAALSAGLLSGALVSVGVADGAGDVEEESCPEGFVSFDAVSSGALLLAVASGGVPVLGSCCWAIREGTINKEDKATEPKTRRNFINHSPALNP